MLPGLGVLCETWKCTSPPQNTPSDRETYPGSTAGPPACVGSVSPRLVGRVRPHVLQLCDLTGDALSPHAAVPYTLPALTAPARCALAGSRACSHAAVSSGWEGRWLSFTLLSCLSFSGLHRAVRPELSSAFVRRQLEPRCWLANLRGVQGRQCWWCVTSWRGNLDPTLLLSISFFKHSSP